MAFVLLNRFLQSSVLLQSRSHLFSSSCFRATKRHESSSGPVRYIPEDYTDSKKKSHDPRLLGRSKGKASSSKNGSSKTVSVAPKMPNLEGPCSQNGFLDANYFAARSSDISECIEEFSDIENDNNACLGLMEADAKNEFESFLGENSDADKVTQRNEKVESKLRQDAEKLAIELLATRAFTVLELRKKLRGKKYPLNVVDSVIASIKDRGLLNDGFYAESFSRSRWLSSTWGPKRIKQALIQKGVTATEVDRAMKQVFEDDAVSGDYQDVQHGMSKASLERLYLQASKQWLRGQATSFENRKSRIIRWLQYRGFSWGVAGIILRRLEAEHPP